MSTDRQLLERRVRLLERDLQLVLQQLATRQRTLNASASSHVNQLVIDRGNTLSDGTTLGIKLASSISTVPSVYDPNVTSSFIDGIGRATLYVDGVAQSGFVLVVHDGRTGDGITDALVQGDSPFAAASTVTIPLAGDPTQSVTCYVPEYM